MTEKEDKHFYLIANEEWDENIIDVALLAKCMTINEGDKKKSKYDYLIMRVESLIKEEREKARRKKEEARKKEKEARRKEKEARRRIEAEIKQKEALLKQKEAREKEKEFRRKRDEARKKYLKQVQSEIGSSRLDNKLWAEAVAEKHTTGHEAIVSCYIEKRISMLMKKIQ